MARFRIEFADGKYAEYHGAKEFMYVSGGKTLKVSENLHEHLVPIGQPFWIRTPDGVVSVNGDGIRLIEVTAD